MLTLAEVNSLLNEVVILVGIGKTLTAAITEAAANHGLDVDQAKLEAALIDAISRKAREDAR